MPTRTPRDCRRSASQIVMGVLPVPPTVMLPTTTTGRETRNDCDQPRLYAVRRTAYRRGWSQSFRVSRPVVVVGNITVGGTGKTPMTIWLAERLRARGVRVGIVLRGYGGTSAPWPRDVTSQTSPEEVGDEAVLLAIRTGALVVAAPDRVAAANRAIERGAQVIVCDDG